ncbi:prenyltransferase alpha subunit [Xylariales sp. AK1849]|nr:prenyltransferase alpha subunit [Xylariales sp. AK1849]
MPPKGGKGASSKAKGTDCKSQASSVRTNSHSAAKPAEPQTVFQRAQQVYEATNPYQAAREKHGLHGLSTVERTGYINSEYVANGTVDQLSKKAQKELWKQVNESNTPTRKLPKPSLGIWGKDKYGRNIGDYNTEQFEDRRSKERMLFFSLSDSQTFREKRYAAKKKLVNGLTGEQSTLEDSDIEAERERRKMISALKEDLYGNKMGPYSTDPGWDDVIPIPQTEPEGALASIAYPEDYAESMSFLRAVMAAKEYSPRCLKLTEHIIAMNPAHYTVWLYRFEIVQFLNIPILDELSWLDETALNHQKNYQIWHHRQLLVDHYYPIIADTPDEVKRFAKSERDFTMEMFAEDAKNYHVWSYRQYAVRKLGMWDEDELQSIEFMINQDVRNNSAWSHRFYLVFSNPAYATKGSHATDHDPAVPADVIDREIDYAKEKIKMAPQNQSPWNYLTGVLVKGGRKLGSVREYVEGYVNNLGEEGEQVRSSHALDHLADIYKEAGEKDKADLCLRRLGEKWDPIRMGYWEWKRKSL